MNLHTKLYPNLPSGFREEVENVKSLRRRRHAIATSHPTQGKGDLKIAHYQRPFRTKNMRGTMLRIGDDYIQLACAKYEDVAS